MAAPHRTLAALVLLALLPAGPAAGGERYPTRSLPEFDYLPVVRWDSTERWSFGGGRFRKLDEFYHPLRADLAHPWMISTVDLETSFQQMVIDGFAPSFEPLVGEKWRDLKAFLEKHKHGSSVRFVFILTDRRLTFFHEKGTRNESRFECAVVEHGTEAYFAGPKPEHFDHVDEVEPQAAYEASLALYRRRLEWAKGIREYAGRPVQER